MEIGEFYFSETRNELVQCTGKYIVGEGSYYKDYRYVKIISSECVYDIGREVGISYWNVPRLWKKL